MFKLFSAIGSKFVGGSLLASLMPWLLGLCLFAMAGQYVYHRTIVAGLEQRLKVLDQEKGSLTADNAQLATSLKGVTEALNKQNKALDNLVKASNEQADAVNAQVTKMQTEIGKWKGKYAVLLNQPKPPAPEECAQTAKLMQDYYDLRHQEATTPPPVPEPTP